MSAFDKWYPAKEPQIKLSPPLRPMTEEDVRRVVREELARDRAEREKRGWEG